MVTLAQFSSILVFLLHMLCLLNRGSKLPYERIQCIFTYSNPEHARTINKSQTLYIYTFQLHCFVCIQSETHARIIKDIQGSIHPCNPSHAKTPLVWQGNVQLGLILQPLPLVPLSSSQSSRHTDGADGTSSPG